MKVLINAPDHLRNGGVANFYRMLSSALSGEADFFVIGGANGYRKNVLFKLVGTFVDYFAFIRLLRKDSYDIVHLNPSLGMTALLRDAIYVLIAKAFGCSVLLFFHGWDPKCEAFVERFALPLFEIIYFKADIIVVLAQSFKTKLLEWGYRKEIDIIATCVAQDFIEGAAKVKRDVIPEKLLFLARIEKAKGVYEAIDAYKIIKQKHPGCSLVIAGSGSELENLKQFAADEGLSKVTFPGYLRGDDKLKVFAGAGCYIFPSHSEGMPISVLEAMAAGLPVVTSAVGGLPDFFSDYMGHMVEGYDSADFAEAVEKIFNDQETSLEMSEFNFHYAREHFSPRVIVVRLKKIYRSLSG